MQPDSCDESGEESETVFEGDSAGGADAISLECGLRDKRVGFTNSLGGSSS